MAQEEEADIEVMREPMSVAKPTKDLAEGIIMIEEKNHTENAEVVVVTVVRTTTVRVGSVTRAGGVGASGGWVGWRTTTGEGGGRVGGWGGVVVGYQVGNTPSGDFTMTTGLK